MNETRYEFLPDSEPTFEDDLQWARRHPTYWAEKLKLDVADAVADTLARQGLPRAELARRMGTSPAFVTKILRGYHNWSLETLAKAGVALGLQWLLVPAPIDAAARVYTRLQFPDARPGLTTSRAARNAVAGEWSLATPDTVGDAESRNRTEEDDRAFAAA